MQSKLPRKSRTPHVPCPFLRKSAAMQDHFGLGLSCLLSKTRQRLPWGKHQVCPHKSLYAGNPICPICPGKLCAGQIPELEEKVEVQANGRLGSERQLTSSQVDKQISHEVFDKQADLAEGNQIHPTQRFATGKASLLPSCKFFPSKPKADCAWPLSIA